MGTSRILSFDPGESTGIAFIKDGKLVWAMTARVEAFRNDNFFTSLTKMTQPTVIIVEAPPAGTRFPNEDQQEVFSAVTKFFTVAGFDVKKIFPSQWKNLVKRSDLSGTHMRDAADMAMWFERRQDTRSNER